MPSKRINKKNFASLESGKKYDYDVVLQEMGKLGKYQILLLIMSYYVAIPTGMNQVGSVFLTAVPDFRCRLPELEGTNLTEKEIEQLAIPIDKSGRHDFCSRYQRVPNCSATYLPECFLNQTTSCTDGYVYDRTVYDTTTVTEWDLVCDGLIWGTLSTLAYFFGVCVASIVGGSLSDRFGRTRVTLCACLLNICVGICCAYSPNLAIFSITRFLIAGALMAQWGANFVYMIEIIPDKWRTVVGINVQGAFACGYIILSGMSYIWRGWRDLQFAITFCAIVYPVLWIFIPESPRWLLSTGRIEKGKKVSEEIARKNGRPLPDDIWDRAVVQKNADDHGEYSRLPHVLFKLPHMRRITFKMMFLWFSVSYVFYGLSLNVGNLAGDDRVNNALSGLCEVLSCPLAILTIDRFGRKPVLFTTFVMSGISCIISAVTNYFSTSVPALGIVGTVFAMCGKLLVSAAFGIIYNYTAELYPTVVRGTAIGTGSMSARIGSMFSPLIILIQYSIPWLTGTLFGLIAIIAGFVCLFLPETKCHSLTTTIDEAERFYAYYGKSVELEQKNNNEETQGMI